ncbi:MAG: glycerate kinase [Anaerolineaceae bacterium]
MIHIPSLIPELPSYGKEITRIVQAALVAADPEEAVRNCLNRNGDILSAGEKVYHLGSFKHIYLLGAGKASFAMAKAVTGILEDRELSGAILVKYLPTDPNSLELRGIHVFEGDHPTPGGKSLRGSKDIIEIARRAGQDDLVIFCLSGGASALLTSPLEGIGLDDLQSLTGLLLASGADIGEINTLRKHLDELKGGGLAAMIHPAELLVPILSDVVGSPLDVIGSGPTAGDNSSFTDALFVLEKYNLFEKTPAGIMRILREGLEGRIPETVRSGDPILERVNNFIVGSVEKSAQAAFQVAVKQGFESMVVTTSMTGEAREKGQEFAKLVVEKTKAGCSPFCLIAGGETTVTIKGKGLGGRNLELALAAVEGLAGLPGAALISLATDGDDGPSGAAGAVVTGATMERAKELSIDLQDYLENNDSFTFFQRVGGLLVTGPTGTNVNDLVFLFGNLSNKD